MEEGEGGEEIRNVEEPASNLSSEAMGGKKGRGKEADGKSHLRDMHL